MMNPIRDFREQLSLSLNDMARLASVTPLAIIRSEQGVFTSVPPSVVSAVLNSKIVVTRSGHALVDPDSIQEAYEAFQRFTRRSNYGQLSPDLPPFKPGVSPLVHWRLTSNLPSQMGFCKAFCVHPSPVAQIERGLQRKLPGQLIDGLSEAGYDDIAIQELARRQMLYTEPGARPHAS